MGVLSVSTLLVFAILLYTDLSFASPRGRWGSNRYGSGSRRWGGSWGGARNYGGYGKTSSKIVCRAQHQNGTEFFNTQCPDPLTTACRVQSELDIIRGRTWEDGSAIMVNKYLCEQLPCQLVNIQNPLQGEGVPRECPTGKSCQPLPRDFYGRERLIYRAVTEPGYEARYCQAQICKVTDRTGATLEGSESVCPATFTCTGDRWNCGRGQVYLRVNPTTGATDVIPNVAVSKCKTTTTTVDPNAAYNELINSFGQAVNWWDVYSGGRNNGGNNNPEIIPVPVPGVESVAPLPITDSFEDYPIDPRDYE